MYYAFGTVGNVEFFSFVDMRFRDNTISSMAPPNAVVIEVEHTILNRTLYFSLMRKYPTFLDFDAACAIDLLC
jgi:hypothetical protein